MNTSCFVCTEKMCWAKSLDITTDRNERKQNSNYRNEFYKFSGLPWSERMKQQESLRVFCLSMCKMLVCLPFPFGFRFYYFIFFFSLYLPHSLLSISLQTYSTVYVSLLLLLMMMMMCFSVLWTLIRNANLFLTPNIALPRITDYQNNGKENDLMSLLISSMIFTHKNSFEFLFLLL